MFDKLRNLFEKKKKETPLYNIIQSQDYYISEKVWVRTEDSKPSDLVLAAIKTLDCGWVIHVAWWSSDRKCWMGNSDETFFNYTHWIEAPPRNGVYGIKWDEINSQTPRDIILLVSTDSYDCGWTLDSSYIKKGSDKWLTTCYIIDIEMDLKPTHFMLMPDPPED